MHCILFFLVVCEIILYYSAHLSICQTTIPGGSNNNEMQMGNMEIEKKKVEQKESFFLDGQMEEAEGWKAWMESWLGTPGTITSTVGRL